jgi:hypothetical protein
MNAQQYQVIYANGGINTQVTGTVTEIATAMRARFTELNNVEPTVSGNTVTFTVRTGAKASSQYYVVYANGGINTSVTGTVSEITAAMRARFTELNGVEPTVNGNTVTFTVRTGAKATG